MDTSVLLCPVRDTMITLHSVIQRRPFCLCPKKPMLLRHRFQHRITNALLKRHKRATLQKFYNFFTIVERFAEIVKLFEEVAETLDDSGIKTYDYFETQGIKNSFRIFLQGTEAILPDHWETLFSLESAKHQAFSPCNGITYNCIHERLDSGIIHRASLQIMA